MGLSTEAAQQPGVRLGPGEPVLAARAYDFLAAGPADVQSLISYVCQLPGAPRAVAEHIAVSLLAGDARFDRDSDGRWRAVMPNDRGAAPGNTVVATPVTSGPALRAMSYVVVDVETTGGRPTAGDRITEIAVVLVRDRTARTVFETLVNPQRPIPRGVTALTNISWEMVKDAPRFADVCDQLLGALEGHVFVAHNAGFDWRFLSMEVARATGRSLGGQRLCTVKMARKLVPQLRRRSLDYVAAHYAVEIQGRHRAGGDARATACVLLRLLDDAERCGCETWEALERLLGARSARRAKRRRPSAMPQPVTRDTTA